MQSAEKIQTTPIPEQDVDMSIAVGKPFDQHRFGMDDGDGVFLPLFPVAPTVVTEHAANQMQDLPEGVGDLLAKRAERAKAEAEEARMLDTGSKIGEEKTATKVVLDELASTFGDTQDNQINSDNLPPHSRRSPGRGMRLKAGVKELADRVLLAGINRDDPGWKHTNKQDKLKIVRAPVVADEERTRRVAGSRSHHEKPARATERPSHEQRLQYPSSGDRAARALVLQQRRFARTKSRLS